MTDRELLELAAKAAGVDWIKDCVWIENGFYSPLAKHERIAWNPLNDDGDALRLAVRLGLAIRALEKCVYVESDPETLLGQSSVSELEMYKGDPYAATRLAIVRAAAEIGKGME